MSSTYLSTSPEERGRKGSRSFYFVSLHVHECYDFQSILMLCNLILSSNNVENSLPGPF